MQKLRSLEIVRAVAALLVVLFHTQSIFVIYNGTTPFGGLFHSGFRGVDLFFVLSGFIITYVHASDIGRPWRLGNYVFNRAARLYPAVWIVTVFAGSLYATGFGGANKIGKLTGWGITASMLLLPQTGDALVNVTWTLKYELFFYFIFAVMILNLWVGLTILCIWQFAVLIFTIWFSSEALGLEAFYLRSLCLEFTVGLVCAWLVGRSDFIAKMRSARLQWALLGTGSATFGCGMMADAYIESAGILCALGAGAIIIGLTLLEQSGRIQVPGLFVMLGGASYAIYLVHFSTITLLVVVMRHVSAIPLNNVVFLTMAAFGVAAGIAFDRVVDRPIQQLLRRRLKPMLLGVRMQATSQLP